MISGLNRTAFDLAVYASQGWSPTHHARLASGCWSSSTGRDWLPAGFHLKGFKFPSILLSRAILAQGQALFSVFAASRIRWVFSMSCLSLQDSAKARSTRRTRSLTLSGWLEPKAVASSRRVAEDRRRASQTATRRGTLNRKQGSTPRIRSQWVAVKPSSAQGASATGFFPWEAMSACQASGCVHEYAG